MHAAIATQTRLLGLSWDAKKDLETDRSDTPLSMAQSRIQQRFVG